MADHVMVCFLSTGDFIFLSCVFSIRSMTAEGLRSQLRLAGCEPASYSYLSSTALPEYVDIVIYRAIWPAYMAACQMVNYSEAKLDCLVIQEQVWGSLNPWYSSSHGIITQVNKKGKLLS